MQDIHQFVAATLARACKVDPRSITPATDVFADLGVDSAQFLDASFVIEDEFGIRLPVAEWMSEVNEGEAAHHRFRMDHLVAAIEAMVKQARS